MRAAKALARMCVCNVSPEPSLLAMWLFSPRLFRILCIYMLEAALPFQRGTCIKGLKWPPLKQKTEICFSHISLDSFIRRIAEV